MKLITNKDQSKEAAIFLLNKRYGNLKEYRTEKYPKYVYYYRPTNKKIIMMLDLKNGHLWGLYDEIGSFLEIFFHYNYGEKQEVIKIWVEKAYNLMEITPQCIPPWAQWEVVEESYNLKK